MNVTQATAAANPRVLLSYVIEEAQPEQAALLTQFAIDSNAYWNYRSVSEEEVSKVFTLSEKTIKEGHFKLMKRGDELIGFFGILAQDHFNELCSFFLHPKHIGKGLGRQLFNETIRVARELDWTRLEWESDPFAAPFYREMGATEIPGKEIICRLNPDYKAPRFEIQIH